MAFGSGNNSGFDLLNLKPHKVSTDIEGNLLIYGLPKTGKTSFAFNMWKEKCLILATERGYNYLDGAMALDITKFSDFSKILKQLREAGLNMYIPITGCGDLKNDSKTIENFELHHFNLTND